MEEKKIRMEKSKIRIINEPSRAGKVACIATGLCWALNEPPTSRSETTTFGDDSQ
jgi:hypothetical protein